MKKIDKNNTLANLLMHSDGAVSVLVVMMGFLCGTILILCVGRNPAGMYKAILQVITGFNIDRGSFNVRYIGDWLTISVPLILCGLSMAFAARTGLFNIGGEGQYIMGLTVAQVIGIFGPQISLIHWILCLAGAIVVGALWGGIVGFLKAKYEVSEVVSTIMLNYIALYLSRMITMLIPDTTTFKTPDFPQTALLSSSFFYKITNTSNLNYGFIIMFLGVLFFIYIMEKTSIGFSLRATGFNKEAARCSGISVVRSIMLSMAISGAFAGLAGGIVALGSFNFGRVLSGMDNYGFTGIAVALVGNNTGIGTLLSGLLFGVLQASQPLMQSQRIPKEITFIIQGLIVIFIAIRSGIRMYITYQLKKNSVKTAESVLEEK
ncbi:MAG: ABC transporter permease [Treponemataceae bacterium]